MAKAKASSAIAKSTVLPTKATVPAATGDLATVGREDGRSTGDTSEVVVAGVALLVAVAVGWALGGSLAALGSIDLRARSLVWAAVAAQALGAVIGGPAYALGLIVSALLVGRFLLRNRGIRGTGLLALGLLANALVVGLNGAMPVSVVAAGRSGTTTQDILIGADPRHEISGAGTRLSWLGDVIPAPWPARPEVISPGDVLVAAGLAQLVVLGMRPGRSRARHARPKSRAAPVQRL